MRYCAAILMLALVTTPTLAGSWVPTNGQIMAGAYAYDDASLASNRLVAGGIYTGITASVGGLQCNATAGNWVELPDIFDGASTITIAAWMRRGPNGELAWITRKGSTDGASVFLGPHAGGVGNAYFWCAGGGDSYGYVALAGNDWHHYAMVFDGGQAENNNRLIGYIDGVQQSLTYVGTFPGTIGSSGYRTSIVIGAYDYTGYDAQGYFRHVVIATNTITSNQQHQLYVDTSPATYNTAWASNVPNAWVALSLSRYWDSNVVAAAAARRREAVIY